MPIIHVPLTKRARGFHVLPQVFHTRLDDARRGPVSSVGVPQPFPAAETPWPKHLIALIEASPS